MNINTKITYRGWLHAVIEANGWTDKTFRKYRRLCLEDVKGMAAVWLRDGRNTYHKTYLDRVRRFRRLKNRRKKLYNQS